MKTKVILGFTLIFSVFIFFNACVKKDFDEPDVSYIPFDPDKVLTIADIKQLYDSNHHYYKFTDIFSVFATVTMDDKSGNIYKSAFIQDNTGGIDLYLNSSGLYQGDSIRIMLQGTIISDYSDLIQITNLDIEKNIVKIKPLVEVEPLLVTLQDIINIPYEFQSELIKLEAVQFIDGELGKTFADAQNLDSENRLLEDCYDNQVDVRTSGYADFADLVVPVGKGSMIAIASYYDGNVQLVIRSINELQLDSLRCDGTWGPIIFQGFDDGFNNWNPIS
ncbi:MAG: DUF5689 domain-containing protein, partial [Bacteroidales bacterium]|nr:DUF5689 domain-containing protein [Bacteroidales bacterium]